MIADDHNFTATAEVHVPQMCFLPKDYKKGCMFPGATNYDPTAVQPTNCHYQTKGCTSATAVNYNKEAHIDDGSCITSVLGCTVKSSSSSYVNVASETPGYEQRFVGMPLRHVGEVILTSYGEVLNYDQSANVNSGCIVAIEGCMDATAVNYDSKANKNSNTWCIPKRYGCMMPPYNSANENFWGSGTKAHLRDGGASNFDATATVHVPSDCHVERFGCTDSMAWNYDPHASVDYNCYPATGGCLDDSAVNYNCTSIGEDDCSSGTCRFVKKSSPCTNAVPRIAYHEPFLCNVESASPPPPPNGITSGSVKSVVVETTLKLAGSVEDFGSIRLAEIAASFDASTGLTGTVFRVQAASVNLVGTTPVNDESAATAAKSSISSSFSSISSLNSALGVEALDVPVVVSVIEYGDANDSTAAIIGGAVGGAVGGLLIIGGAFMMMRKGNKVEA